MQLWQTSAAYKIVNRRSDLPTAGKANTCTSTLDDTLKMPLSLTLRNIQYFKLIDDLLRRFYCIEHVSDRETCKIDKNLRKPTIM